MEDRWALLAPHVERRERFLDCGFGVLVLQDADCRSFLATVPHRSPTIEETSLGAITSGPIHDFAKQMMFFTSGDAHAQVRMEHQRFISSAEIGLVGEAIRSHTHALAGGRVSDFYSEIAVPLTLAGFSAALGIDSKILAAISEPVTTLTSYLFTHMSGEHVSDLEAALDFVCEAARVARSDNPDGIWHEWAHLDELDFGFAFTQMAIAAFDTTAATATFGAWRLLTEQLWGTAGTHPDKVTNEVIRFAESTAGIARLTTEDTVFEGLEIPAGTLVFLQVMAAGKCPAGGVAHFEPGSSNISAAKSLTFGWGEHRCLGVRLAVAELQGIFGSLGSVWPNTTLISVGGLTSPLGPQYHQQMAVALA